MSSFDQSPTAFHSFIVEGLQSPELISFAKSLKLDQAVRGATHCEISLYQVDGVDKLEAKNVFSSVEARDEFLSRLTAPNHEALANMGVRMSSHSGTIVFNSSTGQSSMAHAQVSDSAPSSEVAQPNKAQWPELKNTPSAEAMRIIMGQRPDVKAMLVPQGSMVTMDMRMDRVRVFHDPATGMVTSIPRIG